MIEIMSAVLAKSESRMINTKVGFDSAWSWSNTQHSTI